MFGNRHEFFNPLGIVTYPAHLSVGPPPSHSTVRVFVIIWLYVLPESENPCFQTSIDNLSESSQVRLIVALQIKAGTLLVSAGCIFVKPKKKIDRLLM